MASEPRDVLEEEPPAITVGRLKLLPDEFQASYDGTELGLTYRQFRLLLLFASRPGRVLRRDVIAAEVWDGDAPGRSVDIQVSRLRKMLPPGAIKTVVRVGYRLALPDDH
jgi:DNA-binding response OmpR family regulator